MSVCPCILETLSTKWRKTHYVTHVYDILNPTGQTCLVTRDQIIKRIFSWSRGRGHVPSHQSRCDQYYGTWMKKSYYKVGQLMWKRYTNCDNFLIAKLIVVALLVADPPWWHWFRIFLIICFTVWFLSICTSSYRLGCLLTFRKIVTH